MSASSKGQNRVVVYPDWCKGCGICIAFCPKHVLAAGPDGKARVVAEDACVNCGFCEPHCPDFAIVVTPRGANGKNGRANGNGVPEAGENAPESPEQTAPPAPKDPDKEERP